MSKPGGRPDADDRRLEVGGETAMLRRKRGVPPLPALPPRASRPEVQASTTVAESDRATLSSEQIHALAEDKFAVGMQQWRDSRWMRRWHGVSAVFWTGFYLMNGGVVVGALAMISALLVLSVHRDHRAMLRARARGALAAHYGLVPSIDGLPPAALRGGARGLLGRSWARVWRRRRRPCVPAEPRQLRAGPDGSPR